MGVEPDKGLARFVTTLHCFV